MTLAIMIGVEYGVMGWQRFPRRRCRRVLEIQYLKKVTTIIKVEFSMQTIDEETNINGKK